MFAVILLVVLGTSTWVGIDASRLGGEAWLGVRLVVENRRPGDARVHGFENSTGGGAHIDDARIGFDHCEIIHAPAHDSGADVAEFQILESGFVRRLRERGRRE